MPRATALIGWATSGIIPANCEGIQVWLNLSEEGKISTTAWSKTIWEKKAVSSIAQAMPSGVQTAS